MGTKKLNWKNVALIAGLSFSALGVILALLINWDWTLRKSYAIGNFFSSAWKLLSIQIPFYITLFIFLVLSAFFLIRSHIKKRKYFPQHKKGHTGFEPIEKPANPKDFEKLIGPDYIEEHGISHLGVIPYHHVRPSKEKRFRKIFQRIISYVGNKFFYGNEQPPSYYNDFMWKRLSPFELINHRLPAFPVSEEYRRVSNYILFSPVKQYNKTILFTSSIWEEGRSATVANMAVACSQLDKRILVVDADMRNPRLSETFGLRKKDWRGLSGYLHYKVSLNQAIQKTSIVNVWILPSGPIFTNPAELLSSKRMKAMIEEVKKWYDVILIDSSPVQPTVDPVIISSIVDYTVLIVKAGMSKHKLFLYTVGELRKAKANIIGVLFNGLKLRKDDIQYPDFYRYYYYNHFLKMMREK